MSEPRNQNNYLFCGNCVIGVEPITQYWKLLAADEDDGDSFFYYDKGRRLRFVPLTDEDKEEYSGRVRVAESQAELFKKRTSSYLDYKSELTDVKKRSIERDADYIRKAVMQYKSDDAVIVKNFTVEEGDHMAFHRQEDGTIGVNPKYIGRADEWFHHEMGHALQHKYEGDEFFNYNYGKGGYDPEESTYARGIFVVNKNLIDTDSTIINGMTTRGLGGDTVGKVRWSDTEQKMTPVKWGGYYHNYGEFQAELFENTKTYPNSTAYDLLKDDKTGALKEEIKKFEKWGYHFRYPTKRERGGYFSEDKFKYTHFYAFMGARGMDSEKAFTDKIDSLTEQVGKLNLGYPVTRAIEDDEGRKMLLVPFSEVEKGKPVRGIRAVEVKSAEEKKAWNLHTQLQETMRDFNIWLGEKYGQAGMTGFTEEQAKRLTK